MTQTDYTFGRLDISVPEKLKEHFSEMCPIFKNIDIHGTKDIIGEHMSDYCTQNAIPVLSGYYIHTQAMF